ncbi:hypothetical protein [Nocardioides sp. URHA0020]|uniref:hypothetical protein n=1 Tax=Nocardioides sp. URHA0020 TaxID=1380392 RepID=UPI000A7BD39F|nr:hypothetical protein [Nocardioides sp. URHA0020]
MVAIEGIHEPLARSLHLVLRRAVADHAMRERRRVHPPLLHVGWPGGPEDVYVVRLDERLDHALRTDVVAAMLHTARRHAPVAGAVPILWLTRSGPLEVGDLDLAWLAAARSAGAEAAVDLVLVVVTRHGWFDPRTGVRREWKRLRNR